MLDECDIAVKYRKSERNAEIIGKITPRNMYFNGTTDVLA